MFLLLFITAGLFVLGRLFFLHTSPPFSEGWIVQLAVGLGFTLFGFVAFFFSSKQQRSLHQYKALQAAHPQQPWLWREDWRQGYAESGTDKQSPVLLVMGMTFLLITLPFAETIISSLQHGTWQVLYVLIFPVSGVGLLIAFVRERIRLRRFGRSRFEFIPPISLGSHLTGKITMKGLDLLNQPATVQLTCVRVVSSASAATGSSTAFQALWQGSCTTIGQIDSHGVALPIDIAVPYDAQATTNADSQEFIEWLLKVTSHVAGVDFTSQYVIPVYRTDKSNPALTRMHLRHQEFKSDRTALQNQFKSFTVQQTASGLQVTTRRGLAWVNSVIGIIVSIFLFGIFTLIATSKAIMTLGPGNIFGWFIHVVAVVLPVFVFTTSFIGLFSKTYLTFDPKSLNVKKSGLIPSSRRYQYSVINSVDVDIKAGSANTSLYYLILNLNQSGVLKKKRILYCKSEEDVNWLVAQLEDRLPNAMSRK